MAQMIKILVLTLFMGALGACSSDKASAPKKPSSVAAKTACTGPACPPGGTADAGTGPTGANTKTMTEQEVMSFLSDNCSACHGNDSNGNPLPNHSAWPLDKDALSQTALEVSVYAPIVYATLYNRVAKTPLSAPSAMPQGDPDDATKASIQSVLGWFVMNLPFVVAEAEQTYGLPPISQGSGSVSLKFQCANPVTARTFLSRLMSALFDRPPTPKELSDAFSADEVDNPVTLEGRRKAMQNFRSDTWTAEFVETGLKKLAAAIGGAPGIRDNAGLDGAVVAELKEEFYQLLKKHYQDWDYIDFLTSDKVMVSDKTAAFYACPGPTAGTWNECDLMPPRSGFFTTLGFLNSKPSSFLVENNNYGRVAMIYFTIMGQSFGAATNGPAGTGVKPLPSCLEDNDLRMRGGAPRGSAAVPHFGNYCQSCHVSRSMAAGSILFRPFSKTGQVFTTANLTTVDANDYIAAVGKDWTRLPSIDATADSAVQVDQAFLTQLLNQTQSPKSCAVSTIKGKEQTPFTTVNDLAKYLMQDRSALVRGFIRHAHRAFSSSQTVNFDLVYAALEAYQNGKRKIPDLLESYFMSETFACSQSGDQ